MDRFADAGLCPAVAGGWPGRFPPDRRGPIGPGAFLFGALAAALFAWRVTRGGRASRILLIVGTALAFLATAFEIAPDSDWRYSRSSPPARCSSRCCSAQRCTSAPGLAAGPPRNAGGPATRRPGRLGPGPAAAGPDLVRPARRPTVTLVGLSHLGPPPGCEDARPPGADVLCAAVAEDFRSLAGGRPPRTGRHLVRDAQRPGRIHGDQHGGALRRLARPADAGAAGPDPVPAAAIVASLLAGLTLSAATGGFPLTWVTASQEAPGLQPFDAAGRHGGVDPGRAGRMRRRAGADAAPAAAARRRAGQARRRRGVIRTGTENWAANPRRRRTACRSARRTWPGTAAAGPPGRPPAPRAPGRRS